MNFTEAVSTCFQKIRNFSGRASRSEYWYWVLFTVLIGFFIGILEGAHVITKSDGNTISLILNLITILPSLAVTSRRLHDTDRSFWWVLIAFTIVGLLPLFYWYCKKGTEGYNRFGEDPIHNNIS